MKKSYSRKKTSNTVHAVLLVTSLLLAVLMCIKVTREGLVGFFGWAICAYLSAIFVFSVLRLSGKNPAVSPGRAVIYISLFVMIVCTLHILFAKKLINGNESYIVAPIQGFYTVGGMLVSLITAPFKLLFNNYGVLLAVFFVITAALGLAALYPFIAEIKDGVQKKKPIKRAEIKTNSLDASPKPVLNIGDIADDSGAVLPDSPELLLGTAKTPVDKRIMFADLMGENEVHKEKSLRSADILFGNAEPKKKDEDENIPNFKFFDANPGPDLYTNQSRQRLFEENFKKTFGEKSPEELYNERYGDMPVYAPGGIKRAEPSYDSEFPLENKNPYREDIAYNVPYGNNAGAGKSRIMDVESYTESANYTVNSTEKGGSADFNRGNDIATSSVFEPLTSDGYKSPNAENKKEHLSGVFSAKDYLNTPLTDDELSALAKNFDYLDKSNKPEAAKEVTAAVSPAVSYQKPAETIIKMPTAAKPAPKTAEKAVQRDMWSGNNAIKVPVIRPYMAPPVDLLTNYVSEGTDFPADYDKYKSKIDAVMAECGIAAEVFNAQKGPTFTRYALKLGAGVSPQKVASAKQTIMMRLCMDKLRILAPIQGEDAVGIELPNVDKEMVGLRSIISTREFQAPKGGVHIAFGKLIDGRPFVANLAKMPHLLVAGATGTGKSVFINCLLTSILYKYSPEDVRLLLIDPKRVELAVYQNLPHMLIKETVKEPAQAVKLLMWLTDEMDRRYKFMEELGCNEIDIYNDEIRDKATEPKLPRLVLVVDEMADLMIKGKGEVEDHIVRIAQLGRACGIHLVLATQRPTVNIITGLIKSNILARVAFAVKTVQDSRIILDEGGAESLLGNGDLIYSNKSEMTRIQGAFANLSDIRNICNFIREHNDAVYDETVADKIFKHEEEDEDAHSSSKSDKDDEHSASGRESDFEECLKKVLKTFILENKVSVSSAQSKHNVGYIKARKLVDAMVSRGYVINEGKIQRPSITMEDFNEIYKNDGAE